MSKLIDLTGRRFGTLTVISKGRISSSRKYYWLCECDCGKNKEIMGCHLKSGDVRSCGCITLQLRSKSLTKYGKPSKNIPEYNSWLSIKSRCLNNRNSRYCDYGGRGIAICNGWLNSFETFFDDMGPRPSSKHSIERSNNHGHYSCGKCPHCFANRWPSNCRWATGKEQSRNRRTNHMVEFHGKTMTIVEWSEVIGIDSHVLFDRINRYGWSVEKAFTSPVNHPVNHQCITEFNGETRSAKEWSKITEIPYQTIMRRI